MSNLLVSLVAEWKGQGAFNKAETATEKLSKNVSKLGKALGLALGGAAIVKFAKDSIKAFAEEEKSIAMLTNTLNNLGMGKYADEIYSYIDALQMATGVSDDELRPAFQKLATAGLNAADAQSVLALALDVSAGSGKDLNTVSSALAKAVGGNTSALSKLGVGLSAQELKTMSLNDIMVKLSDTFKNSASKNAETFAGKMARLKVAIDTAKESIGKGLIDGLMAATGSVNIDDLQTKIINLGQTFASIFVATGNLIHDNWKLIKQLGIAMIATFTAAKVYAGVAALIGVINKLKKAFIALRAVGFAAAVAQAAALNPVAGVAAAAALVATIIAGNKALDQFNKTKDDFNDSPFKIPDFTGLTGVDYGDAKRLAALQIAAAKAQAKAAKDALRQKQLSKIFDLNYVQIYAALQGKISDEERTRLELQLAMMDENVNAAEYLAKKLADSQGQTSMLAQFLRTLPDAKNPFEKWGDYLKAIELEAKRIGALSFQANAPQGAVAVKAAEAQTNAQNQVAIDSLKQYGPLGGLAAGVIAGVNMTPTIVVNLDGQAVTNAISDVQINNSLSGSFSQLNRSEFKGAVAQ